MKSNIKRKGIRKTKTEYYVIKNKDWTDHIHYPTKEKAEHNYKRMKKAYSEDGSFHIVCREPCWIERKVFYTETETFDIE